MRKLLLSMLIATSVLVLGACSEPVDTVKNGPYKGFQIVEIIDKYSEYRNMKFVVVVVIDSGFTFAEVSKEEYDRAEVGGTAYYEFFVTTTIKVPRIEVAE